MQPGVTYTRDWSLLDAAASLAGSAETVASILRRSRLQVWIESDPQELEEYSLLFDETQAQLMASDLLRAELTIPREDGAWEVVIEDESLVLHALRAVLPNLNDFRLVEAEAEELPAQRPDASVRCREWNGLWFRSQAEVRVAEAFDRANVVTIPNASVRIGVSADHRQNVEPDFIVISKGKVGVLEVDGARFHPPERADEHHERDRRLREHGIAVVERYPAERCYAMPDDVVAEFLRLLALNG